MRGELSDRDAKCPFFCAHNIQTIACESPVPDSRIKLNFATRKAKDIQYRTFCCNRYQYCELYQMNIQPYEEDEP